MAPLFKRGFFLLFYLEEISMLQLTKFYEKCFEDYRAKSSNFCPVELFTFMSEQRKTYSRKSLSHWLDHQLWTDKKELIDEPYVDENLKKQIVSGLHTKNKVFGTYKKTIDLLRPLIAEINAVEKRPARLLEIGSGSGQLAFALYNELSCTDLTFTLEGSDVVSTYIDEGNAEAQKRNIPVMFHKIDAFHLETLPENSFDIIFCLHSLHHFSPAQLSRIMAGTFKVASKAFLAVDGYRGLSNLLFMAVSGALKSLVEMNHAFFHDSLISARKLYAVKQLELLSRLSCPLSYVTARNLRPGLTMVKIEHKM